MRRSSFHLSKVEEKTCNFLSNEIRSHLLSLSDMISKAEIKDIN